MTKAGDFLGEADFDSYDMNLMNSLVMAAKPESERPEFIVTYNEPRHEKYCWTLEEALEFATDKAVTDAEVILWHGVEPLHVWKKGKQIR